MGFSKYVCPKFEDGINFRQIESILNKRFIDGYPQKVQRFVKEIFHFLDEQPYDLALVDGVLQYTPADKKEHTTFLEPKLCTPLRHCALTVIPYRGRIEVISPLLQLIRHDRVYHGEEGNKREQQHFLNLFCEENNGIYSAESETKITPVVGSLTKFPKQPSGMPLKHILDTLEGLERKMCEYPISSLPYAFSDRHFYIFEKSEADDSDAVKDFLEKGELVFQQ